MNIKGLSRFPAWFLIPAIFVLQVQAQVTVMGKVTDENGYALPYASIYLKGKTKGTVANAEGFYSLDVPAGNHILVCAFVGFEKKERKIEAGRVPLTENFRLQVQKAELTEVVVKANAEDPAYAIIRNAIKKRKEYLNEIREWQTMVYIKGLIRTLKLPGNIMGMKIKPNRDVIDSSGKGIVYFSESLTRYSRRLPDDYHEEVISARLSGNSNGFGFNSPKNLEINFYENNISIEGLNSRGFVSPISDNALHFYRYRYLGNFFEDGKAILRIQVIPRRSMEPLFAGGTIEIIDGNWRIYSINLGLNKASQIELADTLHIRQQMFPVAARAWMPQSTAIDASFGIFGIKAAASFVAVYSDYRFDNGFSSLFREKVIRKLDTSANRKTVAYWDSIRPSPLTAEEALDYRKKDTLEKKLRDPAYLDSLDRINNKFTLSRFLLRGIGIIDRKNKFRVSFPALAGGIQYNTVEQWAYEWKPSIRKWGDSGAFRMDANIRYGFGNRHLNGSAAINKTFGKDFRKRWNLTLNGGKNVFQINPSEPIQPLNNTVGTLLYTVNYMKIYEKVFAQINARHTLQNGIRIGISAAWEDRIPLENTNTTYKWRQVDNRVFTSNYPVELPSGFFTRHQAFLTSLSLRWQPGIKFIEYPNRRITVESEKPVFNLQVVKAFRNVLGSDASFSKWRLSMEDELPMKLAGNLKYYAEVGGFISNDLVQLPDWRHFTGNQTAVAGPYVRSFQLAPYYANSTRDPFFAAAHAEWHLNGLLTNKIPVLKKLNWNLVCGSNAFWVDTKRNYVEFFAGIENILKSIRIDWVAGYDGFNKSPRTGIVVGFSGLLTGQGLE